MTLRRNCDILTNGDGDGSVDENIRLVINAFAYAFLIAMHFTAGGEENEQKKYVGHVQTKMRL